MGEDISIALAVYNGEVYLSALLESLCEQTHKPYEIVICDDASVDKTYRIIKQFENRLPIRYYLNKYPLGVIGNFRQAVSLCKGDYIAFCDQDDVWLPNKLACSIERITMIDGPWPALVYSDLTVVDQNLNLLANSYWKYRKIKPKKETFNSLIYGNFVTGCTMLINKNMAAEVAKMPNEVIMHDFWISCVAYGIGKYSFIETATIKYRQHAMNVTINEAITWVERLKKFKTFLTDNNTAKIFLISEIRQAQLFSRIYSNRLSNSKKSSLDKLFKLETKNPIVRKWKTFLIKILYLYI